MGLKFVVVVILVALCKDYYAHPDNPGSTLKETPVTIKKNVWWNPPNLQNPETDQSYLHYGNSVILPDVSYDQTNQASYRGDPNQNQNSFVPRSNYGGLDYDYKSQVQLLLNPEEPQNYHLCPSFFKFSVISVILVSIIIVNCLLSAYSLIHSIGNIGGDTTTNIISNTNTDNNMDINNNVNDNDNVNVNINDNFVDGKSYDEISENDAMSYGEDGRCLCHDTSEDSWLSTARKPLEGVWSGVRDLTRDFLSENPECASRMACEVASPFVPSSVTPLLVMLPPRMEETRSLLMSAVSGNCALAYDRCPVGLGPAMQWLRDL